MTINEILIIMKNRLQKLRDARINSVDNGDLENVIKIDIDIISTTITIEEITNAILQDKTNDKS